jgi:hypothetical protein
LTILRRFLVLAALLFWQGGLTFYGAVVIPVGARVLGSHRQQAVITREVIPVATGAGLAALVLFFWDVLATRDPSAWRRPGRQFLAIGVAFTWVVLSCLQLILNQRFDPEAMTVEDLPSFHELHSFYLWVFTAQWVLCLLFLLTGLQAWKAEDHDWGEKQRASGPPHFRIELDEEATAAEDASGREATAEWRRE